jgi:hypothetical protein
MTEGVVVISYRRFGTTEIKLGEPKNLVHVLKDRNISEPAAHQATIPLLFPR